MRIKHALAGIGSLALVIAPLTACGGGSSTVTGGGGVCTAFGGGPEWFPDRVMGGRGR